MSEQKMTRLDPLSVALQCFDRLLLACSIDFFGQPWHIAEAAFITDKQDLPAERVRMNVPLAANGPIDLPAEYTITVMTPHGECTISGKANRLKFVKRYDRIDVRYQLSRRHPEDRRLRGKLIR